MEQVWRLDSSGGSISDEHHLNSSHLNLQDETRIQVNGTIRPMMRAH
jgi:hypothetical protein